MLSNSASINFISRLKRPKCNTSARLVKAHGVMVHMYRVTALNRVLGVMRVVSKV